MFPRMFFTLQTRFAYDLASKVRVEHHGFANLVASGRVLDSRICSESDRNGSSL